MALKRIYKAGIVVCGLLLLFGVIGWYYVFYRPKLYQAGEPILIGEPYPYLSQIRFNTVSDDPWEMGNFQPVVKDFLRKDGANYIIGEYEDGEGNVYNAKIFVTGKIDEENYIESIYYQSEDNQGWRSFDALKQEIKPGSRIRVEYLSVIPPEDKQECDLYPLECQMVKVVRGSLVEELKDYEENNIGSESIVFGALSLFSEIYEE